MSKFASHRDVIGFFENNGFEKIMSGCFINGNTFVEIEMMSSWVDGKPVENGAIVRIMQNKGVIKERGFKAKSVSQIESAMKRFHKKIGE